MVNYNNDNNNYRNTGSNKLIYKNGNIYNDNDNENNAQNKDKRNFKKY